MDAAFAAFENDLKRFCRFNPANGTFDFDGLTFSTSLAQRDAQKWLELVIEVQPLNEDDPVETIASALGANYYHLRTSAMPVCFGLKDDPPTLVLIYRLGEAVPATQDVLNMLRQFSDSTAHLKATLSSSQ